MIFTFILILPLYDRSNKSQNKTKFENTAAYQAELKQVTNSETAIAKSTKEIEESDRIIDDPISNNPRAIVNAHEMRKNALDNKRFFEKQLHVAKENIKILRTQSEATLPTERVRIEQEIRSKNNKGQLTKDLTGLQTKLETRRTHLTDKVSQDFIDKELAPQKKAMDNANLEWLVKKGELNKASSDLTQLRGLHQLLSYSGGTFANGMNVVVGRNAETLASAAATEFEMNSNVSQRTAESSTEQVQAATKLVNDTLDLIKQLIQQQYSASTAITSAIAH